MSDTPEAAFAAALVAFQAELPRVVKGEQANAGTYSYSYADLTAVSEAGMPKLAEHGLAFTAAPTLTAAGLFVLRYALVHVEGHREGGDYPLPDPAKTAPQQIGSALTYGRRYCFCAVTGLAPGGDDDDGAKANDARSRDTAGNEDPTIRLKREIVQAGAKINLTSVDDLAAKFAELNGGLVLSDATEKELREFRTWLEKEFSRGQRELSNVSGVNRDGRTKAGTHEAGQEPDRLPGVPADDEFYSEPANA